MSIGAALFAAALVVWRYFFPSRNELPCPLLQLNDIVTDTLELRRYALRTAGVEVTLDLDAALPATWAEPVHLQPVALTLLVNAEQALAEMNVHRPIRHHPAREGGGSQVACAASGPGPRNPRGRDPTA